MKKYYFRVDGGNLYSIATGHITRCLKLAEYIASQENSEIYFIMKNYSEGVNMVNDRFKVILFDRNEDIKNEIEFIAKTIDSYSYFICDLRGIDNYYINEIKKHCLTFILFDDLGVKGVHPDVLINPTPFCYYDYVLSEYLGTTLLLGEKFFFVSQDLIDRSCARDFQKDKYSIMASFGGADPVNITEFFIQDIVPRLEKHNISVILGPANSKKEEIIKKYKDVKNIKFYQNIYPLDDMFFNNDIAFVCGGDTCIEACASGIATFIISSIDYERKIGELLHEKQLAYFITDIKNIKSKSFNFEDTQEMVNNRSGLARLSKFGMSLVDGKGLERVYSILSEEKDGSKYKRNGIYTN